MKKIIVPRNIKIKQALKLLNQTGLKCLIVVNSKKDNLYLGTLTDGDIRRALIKKRSLSSTINNLYNKNSKYLNQHQVTKKKMLNFSKKYKVNVLPILDNKKKVNKIIRLDNPFSKKMKFKGKKSLSKYPLVIMAGGLGTRLEPFTKVLPKALIPINDKSVVEVIINKFLDYGLKDVYLSINHKSEMIKAYFKNRKSKAKIRFVEEKSFLGTCGSLSLLSNKKSKNFIVSNCNVVMNFNYSQLVKFHEKNKNDLTFVAIKKDFKIPYGVCELDKNGELNFIREKPKQTYLTNAGLYILKKEVCGLISKSKKTDFNELVKILKKRKKRVGIYKSKESLWSDIGQINEYKKNFNKIF